MKNCSHVRHRLPLGTQVNTVKSSFDSLQYLLTAKMLRRKPTAIAITSEDIAAFEEARLRKLSEENKHPEQLAQGTCNVNLDPSDELKPLPGDKARIVRTREERIGISRRG
ncbi:unnamed protein product [Penicillium egyptiacum]|uniref:Uncharacterized protein n=1 Tax=Penicillium egyptiacum TaxID=1303716 RepID=A0A9W4KJX2_9EURO|nr:unnamed protein product [Penicillium egyptiacum]